MALAQYFPAAIQQCVSLIISSALHDESAEIFNYRDLLWRALSNQAASPVAKAINLGIYQENDLKITA